MDFNKSKISEGLNAALRRPLNIAELSDVHVGNRRTPTKNTIEILKDAFPDNAETAALDMIIIAGDFFDKSMPLVTETVGDIHKWITQFIRLCAKHNIKVRVLEGTPSHDRNQPKLFSWLADSMRTGADVKYVSGLQIEHIDDFGIDVLYIQDELTSSCAITQELVAQALVEHGLKQVDYTVMHGMFSHRVPKGVIADAHDAKYYQSITRKYVFCGHIHINSRYGNILEAGSSDRISFNEEEDKGHWRVYEGDANNEDKVIHIKHPKAWTYKRVDVCGLDYSAVIQRLAPICRGLRGGSFIQLFADKDDAAIKAIKLIEEEFPAINFKVKDAELTKKMKVTPKEIKDLSQSVTEIRPDNLLAEVSSFIQQQNPTLNSKRVDRLLHLLEGVKD